MFIIIIIILSHVNKRYLKVYHNATTVMVLALVVYCTRSSMSQGHWNSTTRC